VFGYGYGVLKVLSLWVPGFGVFLFLGTVVHSVVLQWLWSQGVVHSLHIAPLLSFSLSLASKAIRPVFQAIQSCISEINISLGSLGDHNAGAKTQHLDSMPLKVASSVLDRL